MSHLNAADEGFVARLAEVLPPQAVRPAAPGYFEEPRGRLSAPPGPVIAPGSAEEVAAAVKLAAAARVGIVPYAGGTGLVGGQLAPDGPRPLVLSLERMAAIRSVRPEEGVLVAEAGAILETVHDAAAEAARLYPLTLASKGSARIGGLLATNAGGVNVLRYGNARDLCLGIEAVLPDGSILHGLSALRKDNTGYDLRHLLIGSEGTLGIITAAALKLYPRPASEAVALLDVASPAAALSLLALARDQVGEGVSAFELMHRTGFDFLAATMPELRLPFASAPEWTVLVELGLARGQAAETALETLFAAGLEADLVRDGVIAQSEAQRQDFWAVRESIPEANKRIGAILSHDISVPLGKLPDFIAEGARRLQAEGPYRINCFGHVGDGNLHYNLFPPAGQDRAAFDGDRARLMRIVHDLVHEMEGSFSAEHGVGRLKVGELERYGNPAKLAAMRAIKAALDPQCIMNPGAVLRG